LLNWRSAMCVPAKPADVRTGVAGFGKIPAPPFAVRCGSLK
jgi:hypothetical protein